MLYLIKKVEVVLKKTIPLMLFFTFSCDSFSKDLDGFLYSDKTIVNYEDVNRESEAWATCAAVYSIVSEVFSSKKALSKQYGDLSNGAELAVIMSHVKDGFTKDISPEKFNSLWLYSKTLGDLIPETRMTIILSEREILGEEGAEKFNEKLINTVKMCQENLDGQQMYIDMWRDLAKSGLLKPE